jgi:hypothetical protein
MAKFSTENKNNWLWTAMIMQPDVVNENIYHQAVQDVREKKSPKSLDKLRFTSYDESRAAQVMYIGPYSEEGPTIQELHRFIIEQDGALDNNSKHHHEVYLGDLRRSDPAKLRTVARQPY